MKQIKMHIVWVRGWKAACIKSRHKRSSYICQFFFSTSAELISCWKTFGLSENEKNTDGKIKYEGFSLLQNVLHT